MSSTMQQTYLTNLRLTLQSAEYTRVAGIPDLNKLGVYIRIKTTGEAEDFLEDSNKEFLPGEILMVYNLDNPVLSTVYRNTKPKGNITKHDNFNITTFWNFFGQPENYSKQHLLNSVTLVTKAIADNFKTFDLKEVTRQLSISYALASGRFAEDSTDSNKLIIDNILDLRDKIFIRMAYDLNNDVVNPYFVQAYYLPLSADNLVTLANIPWLPNADLVNISMAVTNDNIGIIHPASFNYSEFFRYVYIKSNDKRYLLSENKIFDVTNVGENIPRYFTYVK